jgi:hypothetical protein
MHPDADTHSNQPKKFPGDDRRDMFIEHDSHNDDQVD